jgi:nitroreductase
MTTISVTQIPGQQALPLPDIQALSRCMHTLRSVRQFLPAAVDQDCIDFVLRHAVRAGSAKNRQPWRFIVVRDRNTMSSLGDWYRRGWQRMVTYVDNFPDAHTASKEHRAQMQHGILLADTFDKTPVVIAACFVPIPRNPANFYGGASIYPAIENLLLAARAIGLGATLTTLQSLDALPGQNHPSLTDELRTILDIPGDVVPAAVIPLGWPAVPITAGRRLPVPAVTYAERWGSPWTRTPVESGGVVHEVVV